MTYQTPSITDFGSIGQHTFITPSGKDKDWQVCDLDPMFGEYSCGAHS